MNARSVLITFLFAIFFMASCEKGPGEGGTNTIRGHVIVHDYNGDYSQLRFVYPGRKEDVYIIYGGDYVYGDKFETGDSGQYEFNYLRAGSYTVYAFSEDTTDIYGLSAEKVVVKQNLEVSGKHHIIEVPDLIIAK